MKNRFFLLLFGWTMGCALAGLAAEAEKPWEVRALTKDGEVEYNLQTGRWVGSNGVGIKYGETELTAGRIQLDETTGQVQAEGLVTLQQDGQLWKGDRLQYNFKTRQIQADEYKTGKVPYFASGFGLSGDQTNANYRAYYSSLTTDDVDKPGYTIRAKTLIVSPGNYIEARQATVYLGKVPVFYWPYYRRSLQRHPNNIVLTPGYRSRYGPYMLGTYNWYANDNLQGAFNMDYRQKRGVGGGPDLYYDLGKAGSGDFRYYVTRDEDAPLDSVAKQIDDERQRIQFTHKVTLRTNLTAKAVVRYQTDEYFIRDFFEKEYRENIQPSTFLEVNQLWSNFSLNVLAQPQINDFFDTVERLPDIKFTGMRQQLGNSPLYYESESSLGYYRHQFGNNAFPEYAAFRSDTFHQVVLPQTFFGWLNVVPRVGGRWTHYGDSEGPGIPFTEHDRGVFNTGAEISMKASRIWRDASNKFFEVDGIRHIVQPSINYAYVPKPSVQPAALPQFDSELQSFRLLPIEYPDYNNIDSIDSQNVLRFTLRNRLQTKRDGDVEDLLHWALYTDWRLRPRPGQGTFADIFSDLNFKPKSWLTLGSENRYDVSNGVFRQAYHTITLEPSPDWSLSLGHRYLRSEPSLGPVGGHNSVFTTLYVRLNENWGTRVSHVFEARDGTLEEQYYTVYRDLRSWTTALTLRVRDNRTGPTDVTIALTISLKAFPRFNMGADKVTPSVLLGS